MKLVCHAIITCIYQGFWLEPTLCSLMPPTRRSPDTRNCGPDAKIPFSDPDNGVARFSTPAAAAATFGTGVAVPGGVPVPVPATATAGPEQEWEQ